MSRHGRRGRHQHPVQAARPRPATQEPERPASPVETRTAPLPPAAPESASEPAVALAVAPLAPLSAAQPPVPEGRAEPAPRADPAQRPAAEAVPARGLVTEPVANPISAPVAAPAQAGALRSDTDASRTTCTVAQLRRFIKSRPWIPMHELRRRFGIYGADDDVSPIRVSGHTLFIGLPFAESRLMAELLGGGEVGYELSLDPITPIVVGVYPMRPVPRG